MCVCGTPHLHLSHLELHFPLIVGHLRGGLRDSGDGGAHCSVRRLAPDKVVAGGACKISNIVAGVVVSVCSVCGGRVLIAPSVDTIRSVWAWYSAVYSQCWLFIFISIFVLDMSHIT